MAALQRSALLDALRQHNQQQTAVVHLPSGRTFKYGGLLQDVSDAKEKLLRQVGRRPDQSIEGERVAFLVENGYDYVVTLLSILASNAIAVPLAPSFPDTELRYILDHSTPLALLASKKFEKKAQAVLQEGLESPPVAGLVEKREESGKSDRPVELVGEADAATGGIMLYTSGTTSRPKGVLLPHTALVAQCQSLIEAWDYRHTDRLLHVLPLHHIHGTVNALLTPLFAGCTIEFMYPFNVDAVWQRFAMPFLPNGHKAEHESTPITFFTAVPTIWARLLHTAPLLSEELKQATGTAIQREHLRLNISGSAALPTPTKQAWTRLSNGNVLLERFGMTEVGMALSCGLDDGDRIDGSVGWPLPGVEARLFDGDSGQVIEHGEELDSLGKERQGEIQLRGPTIFKEYWGNPTATAKEFTPDGWFKTGDIAARRVVPGAGAGKSGHWAQGPAYFIMGRNNADIIKTGGEKVSALEIERELLSLPQVHECAVVGLPSEAWGQKVAAVVVLSNEGKTGGKGGKEWAAMDMRRALKDRLVAYKIPQDLKIVEDIPRNAMGKINKKELVGAVFGDKESIRRRSISVAEERARLKNDGR